MFQFDDPEIERHLAFREYLRHKSAICDHYAALKRRVYAQHPADIAAYCEGKDNWIKQHEAAALAWFRQR